MSFFRSNPVPEEDEPVGADIRKAQILELKHAQITADISALNGRVNELYAAFYKANQRLDGMDEMLKRSSLGDNVSILDLSERMIVMKNRIDKISPLISKVATLFLIVRGLIKKNNRKKKKDA